MERLPEQPDLNLLLAVKANDALLWENFKGGDRKAFSQIYKQYLQALYSYGTKICADTQIVEDCIQELFIYIWDTKENLGRTDNIKYYLFKSLRRSIHLEIEKGHKKDRLSTSFAYEQPAAEFSPEQVLIADNIQENRQKRMQQALRSLTKRQREAVYLRFYDNLSFQEIADIMGLQIKSTYNLISQAIDVLREHVQAIILSLFIALSLNC